MEQVREGLRRLAYRVADLAATPEALMFNFLAFTGWLAVGLVIGFEDLLIQILNSYFTVTTGLLVYIVLISAKRESRAAAIKQDEELRVNTQADNRLIQAEQRSEAELQELAEEVKRKADGSN